MATHSKILFSNADGQNEQTASTDSLQFTSYKTADWELTNTLLGLLVNAINASAGVGDAGKFIKTNSSGVLDASFIVDSDISHDSTDGMANSTGHLAFPLLAGGRAFTAIQGYDSHKTFSAATDLVDKKYVDDGLAALGTQAEWQISVLSRTNTPAGSPSEGDRYLVGAAPTGAWSGHANAIATYTSSAWAYTTCTVGTYVSVDDETDGLYYFGGSSWTKKYYEATTASLGVKKVGVDVELDFVADSGIALNSNSAYVKVSDIINTSYGLKDVSGDIAVALKTSGGLQFETGEISVKISDIINTSYGLKDVSGDIAVALKTNGGIQFSSGELQIKVADFDGEGLKDDGSNNLAIDWSTSYNDSKAIKASDLNSTANGKGASIIKIEDVASYFSYDTVEGALKECYERAIASGEITMTAGSGGLTKGALVYISANDTASMLPVSGGNSNKEAFGVSKIAYSAAASAKICRNGEIVLGVLTGATAGGRVYWDGTNLTQTLPNGSGQKVWQVGIAKNATDMLVEVFFVRVNS